MRKMSNKGRLMISQWDQVRLRVLLPRPRSLLSGQGRGALWLWRGPGGPEQAGGRRELLTWFCCVVLCRCHYMFGHYQLSISDAEKALRINMDSVSARGCLGINLISVELYREHHSPPGKALYSSGMFEYALLHFYRAIRLSSINSLKE